jgi:glycosyltransferase involved in cell wall biosynthesis
MRILQAFDFFSPLHGGGAVDILYRLSKTLRRRGHEVVIYTSDFELDQGYIDSLEGVKVYPFHSWLSLSGIHFMPGMIAETSKKLKDFDIVHLHCYRSFQNIMLHHYARKYGIPYIVDAHGSTLRISKGKKGLKRLLKWLFDVVFGYRIMRDAGKVVAETEVGANEYKKLGVSPDKIVLIHPPLDIEEFSQLPPPGLFRRKHNIKEKHVILFLGRIHWIKGIDFLVESFHQLAQQRSDVILAIVGPDDGYKPALDKLIDRLNLSDRVIFTGFLGGEEKLSALVDADVLVQPSLYEQGARPSLEAILCNTPAIVSKNTGAGEEVKKIDAGWLVEYGNKSELRDTIQYILDNPEEAQIKTQKAKEYIKENLSLNRQTEKFEKLYNEVIAERKRV